MVPHLLPELSLPARIIPVDPQSSTRVTESPVVTEATTPEDFPLPPEELHESASEYLSLGKLHTDNLRAAVAEAGECIEGNVLDFGCAAGRMTRWMLPECEQGEVWGADVNSASVAWCQRYLSPPFRFTMCSYLPSVPFESGYFGLVYAGSVFTHISEMEDAWLLELRRILRPGGLLYVTIQDEAFIEQMKVGHPDMWIRRMVEEEADLLAGLGTTYDIVTIGRGDKTAMVFHHRDALLRRWSADFDVLGVAEGAYWDQTAILLRKPHPETATT